MIRIGLIADTHIPEAGPDLPARAYAALAGCDRILHAGDLHTLDLATGRPQLRLAGPAAAPLTRGPRPAGGK